MVTPLIMLPAEKEGGNVEEQKEFIRERILNRDNYSLMQDKDAVDLLQQLGGDLMINAFACNFEIGGKVNEDVVS